MKKDEKVKNLSYKQTPIRFTILKANESIGE